MANAAREKKPCPVCNKGIAYLPQHMVKAHKWDRIRAKSVLNDFDLRKIRVNKPEAEMKKKPPCRILDTRYQCPLPNCPAVVLKIRDHIRVKHKIRCKKSLTKLVNRAVPAKRLSKMVEEEEATGSESSEDEQVINVFDVDFGSESEDDEDWMAQRYLTQSTATKGRQRSPSLDSDGSEATDVNDGPVAGFSGASRKPCSSSNHDNTTSSCTESESDSAEDPGSDVEDPDIDLFDNVLMASTDEDEQMDEFQLFLQGIDGGRRNQRTAIAHRQTVQRVLRQNAE